MENFDIMKEFMSRCKANELDPEWIACRNDVSSAVNGSLSDNVLSDATAVTDVTTTNDNTKENNHMNKLHQNENIVGISLSEFQSVPLNLKGNCNLKDVNTIFKYIHDNTYSSNNQSKRKGITLDCIDIKLVSANSRASCLSILQHLGYITIDNKGSNRGNEVVYLNNKTNNTSTSKKQQETIINSRPRRLSVASTQKRNY
jgi:hypothetical protein